jgi:hypothetical protein
MSAEQIKSDTLTILLCNQAHKFLTDKQRAIKISKTCKIIRDRTKDKALYSECRRIIKDASESYYSRVIHRVSAFQNNYFNEYQK